MTSTNSESNKTVGSSSTKNKENLNQVDNTPSATTPEIPSFGWSKYSERINGRFAMIGIIAILLIETISNSSFLHWAGFVK